VLDAVDAACTGESPASCPPPGSCTRELNVQVVEAARYVTPGGLTLVAGGEEAIEVGPQLG